MDNGLRSIDPIIIPFVSLMRLLPSCISGGALPSLTFSRGEGGSCPPCPPVAPPLVFSYGLSSRTNPPPSVDDVICDRSLICNSTKSEKKTKTMEGSGEASHLGLIFFLYYMARKKSYYCTRMCWWNKNPEKYLQWIAGVAPRNFPRGGKLTRAGGQSVSHRI